MTLLPSPIPHPLDYSPFDVPAWAYEALEWVVGFDWPAGDEVATWDVADRWYALATSLAEPRDDAFAAAAQVLSGYGGAGITADGFREAWQQLAGDENAPLNALLQIAQELGELVEQCGTDLEAAKLEAWIEIGFFLIELIGMAVTVALTLGAASPAAGGLIMATRLAIQQIFKRLIAQLGKKALKQTARRTIKDITTKQGLKRLGRGGLREGLDEMGEEAATNAGIQTYQQSGGRAHGLDLAGLGMSAAGGFAGGVASRGADVGSHGHGGPLRGAGGEVLAEFGAAAVYGDLPDMSGLAKSGASGAAGSAMHGLKSSFDIRHFGTPEGSIHVGGDPGQTFADGAAPSAGAATSAGPVAEGHVAALDSAGSASPPVDGRSEAGGVGSVGGSAPPPFAGGSEATGAGGSASNLGSDTAAPATSLSVGAEAVQGPAASTAAPTQIGDGPSAPSLAATSPAADPVPSGQAASAGPATSSVPSASPHFLDQSAPSTATAPAAAPAAAPLGQFTALAALASPSITPAIPADLPTASATSAGLPTTSAVLAGPSTISANPRRPNTTPATSSRPTTTPTSPSRPITTPAVHAGATTTPAVHAGATTPATPSGRSTLSTIPTRPAPSSASLPGATSAVPAGPDDPGATRRTPLSELDRIAEALAPRPVRRSALPDLSVLSPAPSRTISPTTARPVDTTMRLGNPPATTRPTPPTTPPPRTGGGVLRDEAGYFGYADHARRTHELNRRQDYISYLADIAEANRVKILDLGRQADAALRVGSTLRGADHRRQAAELSAVVTEIETQIDLIRTGELAPATVEVDPHDWARINTDVGNLAPGGIQTDDRSALTGSGGQPPIDRSRRYNTYGGLRPPLAVHQLDLENAVPRGDDGRALRLPDPRVGNWFRLANDGGPGADPTRGLNCVDGVLALYDTYLHGRPRVSAPRTFDSYAHGNPNRPIGGEWDGVQRIHQATGGSFQNLCPYVGAADPTLAKPAMDIALRNLTNHLHNSGHGAYAFIITDLEGGGCHSWAAINQNGAILFLDPQVGRITENVPLYRHHGTPTRANIVSMDALVVTGNGTPTPLPYHGPGLWTATVGVDQISGTNDDSAPDEGHRTSAPSTPEHRGSQEASDSATATAASGAGGLDIRVPDGVTELLEETAVAVAAAERLAFESLAKSERSHIEAARRELSGFADQTLTALRGIVDLLPAASDGHRPAVVNESKRLKSAESTARAFLEEASVDSELSLEEFLAGLKDRVRFSVEVSERGYGHTVVAILQALSSSGYRIGKILSFWGTGRGRHNGLNVTLIDRQQRLVEVQFPTPLSRSVGEITHFLYSRVRTRLFGPEERVRALLHILEINLGNDMPAHQPSDLEALAEFASVSHLDTSLDTWIRKNQAVWNRFLETLTDSDTSLEETLEEHNLRYGDVLESPE